MAEKHMYDVPLGTVAKSSYRAPIDGNYEFVEHHTSSNCKPTRDKAKVYRMRGELMPACLACGKRGSWKLVEYKFDIPPEKNATEYVVSVVRGDRPDVAYPSGTKK